MRMEGCSFWVWWINHGIGAWEWAGWIGNGSTVLVRLLEKGFCRRLSCRSLRDVRWIDRLEKGCFGLRLGFGIVVWLGIA